MRKIDVCRALGCSVRILDEYIRRPTALPVGRLIILAGIFAISPEEMLYLLLRNRALMDDRGNWQIAGMRRKVEEDENKPF